MIYILIFIIGCLIIKLYRITKEKEIYYSNYKNCLMALEELQQENQSLKGRIDKVIFFISTTFDHYLVDEYIKKNLLEILKGSDK